MFLLLSLMFFHFFWFFVLLLLLFFFHFFVYSVFSSFHSIFLFFFLFFFFSFFFLFLPSSSHCARLWPFYIACSDMICHFYPLTAFGLLWVSFQDCPLVCQLSSHHHCTMLATPRLIFRQKWFCFVFYLS